MGGTSVTITQDGGGCSSVVSYDLPSCVETEITSVSNQTGPNGEPLLDAGAGYSSYSWNDGSTSQTINVTGPGVYAVTVIDENGCMAESSLTLEQFEYDPKDIFLVMVSLDNDRYARNIYICNNSSPGELTDSDKSEIEKIILKFLPNVTSYSTNPIFWECSPVHSYEYPILRVMNGMDLEFSPFYIKKNESGIFERFYYYVDGDNQAQAYHYQLQIGSITSDINSVNNSYFPINDFTNLPDNVTASLSIQELNSSFALTTAMNIQFRPDDADINPYKLYYSGAEIPDTVLITESTNAVLELKEMVGPDIVDLAAESVDSISWHINGMKKYGLANKTSIGYSIPKYSNDGQIVRIEVNIRKIVDGHFKIFVLKSNIKPQPIPITPGYNTIISLSDPNLDKTLNYLEEAKKRVKAKNPDMYYQLIENRQVNIILTNSSHEKFSGFKPGQAVFGVTDANFFYSFRAPFVVPVSPFISYDSTGGKYITCPVDCDLMLPISNGEYQKIAFEINNTSSMEVPNVVNRIKEIDADLGELIEGWCKTQPPIEPLYLQGLEKKLDTLRVDKRLFYKATNLEIDTSVILPNPVNIFLNTENLNDIHRYATINYYSTYVPGDPIDHFLSSGNTALLDTLIIRQYTRILAHEMAHAQFSINNKISKTKWDKMKEIISFENCLPGKNKMTNQYCSIAGGHEFMNPDGFQTCDEEGKYKMPILNL